MEKEKEEGEVSEGEQLPGKDSEQTKKGTPGFSFLEVMIVIVIMAAIAAIVGPSLFGKLDEAKIKQAKIQMKSINSALDLYNLDNSSFPTTEQGLEALIKKPEVGFIPTNWRGPYINGKSIPKDPWSRSYSYQSDGSSINLLSLGADGVAGGSDMNADIVHE